MGDRGMVNQPPITLDVRKSIGKTPIYSPVLVHQ